MRKTLLLAFALFLSAALSSCSNSDSGTTTYSVTLSPVRTTWPVVREASGQWEIVGEGSFKNTGTEKLKIQSINVRVFETAGNQLAERTYDAGAFEDMVEIFMSTDGSSTPSAGTSELAPNDLGFCHVAALAGDSTVPTLARVTVSFTNGKSETVEIPLSVFDPGQQMIWPLGFSNGDWLAFDTGELRLSLENNRLQRGYRRFCYRSTLCNRRHAARFRVLYIKSPGKPQ